MGEPRLEVGEHKMTLWSGHCRLLAPGACQAGQKGESGSSPHLPGTRLSSPPLPSLAHRYTHVLGKETFLMHWPAEGTAGKKELLDQLEGFSEYMRTHGCES